MISDEPMQTGDRLVLTPPIDALPPPAWATPAFAIAVTTIALIVATGVVSARAIHRKRLRRPSPAATALAELKRAESPAGVAGAVRRYLSARFPGADLSLTTGELEKLPTPPGAEWLALLRECDDSRFAGIPASDDLPERARRLVGDTETRFAEAASRR